MSSSDALVTVEVAWAVTGEMISTVRVEAHKSIWKLKEMLAKNAKTPAMFMDLMFGNQVASDSDCVLVFASRDWTIPTEDLPICCLVLRKQPPRLIDITRDRFQRQRYPLTNPYPDRFPSLQLSDTNVMEYILAADGQGVNDKDEVWSELEFLITQGQLWDDEDDEESYCYRNCTALHYAASLDEVGLCKLILDHPDFHEADSSASLAEGPFCFRDGWTALHVASAAGAREVCALLLQHSKFTALQNQDDAGGLTALHLAVMFGRHDIVSDLLGGFDLAAINLRNRSGMTAVDLVLEGMEDAPCNFYKSKYWKMLELMVPKLDAVCWQALTENLMHESKQDVLRLFQHRGKMLAGAHLGNGHIDLKLLYHDDSMELSAKDDRAQRRHLTQERRKKCLKAQISQKKTLSKRNRNTAFSSGAWTEAAWTEA